PALSTSNQGDPVKSSLVLPCLLLALTSATVAFAGDSPDKGGDKSPPAAKVAAPKDQSAVSHGSVRVGGQTINYTATTGTLVLKNKDEKPIASMSYVAYVKSGVKNADHRPITFLYNGGPGSSTIWLHMLAFGPQRVEAGSGFGRVLDKAEGGVGKGKDVYGFDEDANAFAQFITRYLTINTRWNSPK